MAKKGGNPQNLTPFKKGQTGNPKGRPKRLPELDTLLLNVLGVDKNGTTEAELILASLLKSAKRGDVRAAEVLLDRAYGKVKEKIEHSGGIDFTKSPIEFE